MTGNFKVLLSIILVIISIHPIKGADFVVGNICYNIISHSDLTCEVTSNPNVYQGDIEIPEFVDHGNKTYKVVAIGDQAFNERSYKQSELKSIIIPNSVTRIGQSAFYCCGGLLSINLPSSLEVIDNNAFAECLNIKSVEIPNSVKQIGSWAFYNCYMLQEFIISDGPELLEISRLALKNAGYQWSLYIGRSITNKDNVQLSVSPQILKIADSVNIGDLMTSIDGRNLEELYIGSGVMEFPKDISSLSKLSRFYVGDTNPPICPTVTPEQYQTIKVSVPAGTINLYKNTEGWRNFINLYEEDYDSVIELEVNDTNSTLYDIQGKMINKDYRGLVIKRSSTGKTVKSYNK